MSETLIPASNDSREQATPRSTLPNSDRGDRAMTEREHFEFYWRLVHHENMLINYRFFWGVFVNAGLLAFFASGDNSEPFNTVTAKIGLAQLGVGWNTAIALMCSMALWAEHQSLVAIDRILRNWGFPEMRTFGIDPLLTVRGGGSRFRHQLALLCSLAVFWTLPLFWGFVWWSLNK